MLSVSVSETAWGQPGGIWANWHFVYDGKGLESAIFLTGTPGGSSPGVDMEMERQVRYIIENVCEETMALISNGAAVEYSGALTVIDGLDYYMAFFHNDGGETIAVYAVNAEYKRVYRSDEQPPNYEWKSVKP